jgi:hypothetical protein
MDFKTECCSIFFQIGLINRKADARFRRHHIRQAGLIRRATSLAETGVQPGSQRRNFATSALG